MDTILMESDEYLPSYHPLISQGIYRPTPELIDLNEPLDHLREIIEQQERYERDQRRDDFNDLYDFDDL